MFLGSLKKYEIEIRLTEIVTPEDAPWRQERVLLSKHSTHFTEREIVNQDKRFFEKVAGKTTGDKLFEVLNEFYL